MDPFDWQKVMALLEEIILRLSSTSILLPRTTLAELACVEILEGNAHKWKAFRIPRTGLDQELVSPAI
jgi:hypothetical protein